MSSSEAPVVGPSPQLPPGADAVATVVADAADVANVASTSGGSESSLCAAVIRRKDEALTRGEAEDLLRMVEGRLGRDHFATNLALLMDAGGGL